MRFLLVPLVCGFLGAVTAYNGGEYTARLAHTPNTYGRAFAIVSIAGIALVAGLVLGSGAAWWGHRRGKSFAVVLIASAAATVALAAIMALLTFPPL